MSDLPARLADVMAQHNATLRGIEQPGSVDLRGDRRVLLPAAEQRGAIPPRIAAATQPGSSERSCST